MDKISVIFEHFRTLSDPSAADKNLLQDCLTQTDDELIHAIITALSLSLIENEISPERWHMFLDTLHAVNQYNEKAIRINIGLELIMLTHDTYFRQHPKLLDDAQEVLSLSPYESFDNLCNIASTCQIRQINLLNSQMAKEFIKTDFSMDKLSGIIQQHIGDIEHIMSQNLDQYYLLFSQSCTLPFFKECAYNWFKTWNDDELQSLPEEQQNTFHMLVNKTSCCDSDKFLLFHLLKQAHANLPQIPLSQDNEQTDIDASAIANFYVQRLYRYFTLASFTQARPFKLVDKLRETMVYRLVVVGKQNKEEIDQILS